MSIYTTPLHFGYFLALLFVILFGFRGWQQERLSDKFLALVMFLLAMEIQDYTFGFSGINFLWEELNGFPRQFNLLLGPAIYFYLKTQVNRDYILKPKDLLHLVPYFIYFIFNLLIFVQGSEKVNNWQKSEFAFWIDWFIVLCITASYIYYFYQSIKIYKAYGVWTETKFSETETINLKWLRNFIYLIIAGEIIKYCWSMADYIIDMPYEKDWWWHLFTVGIIAYVGINGFAQVQPQKLDFSLENIPNKTEEIQDANIADYSELIFKIERAFNQEKIFLEPELSLSQLAKRLKTNSTILSAAINKTYSKNFNDFVNEYRIKEFEKQIKNPENKNYTKLAVALDCGFNSKATFNRALKKFGVS